jgi:hypothetical protein
MTDDMPTITTKTAMWMDYRQAALVAPPVNITTDSKSSKP